MPQYRDVISPEQGTTRAVQSDSVPQVTNAGSTSRVLHTKEELALAIRVTTRTVENLQARGMPHLKIGRRRNRYVLSDVLAWLSQGGAA